MENIINEWRSENNQFLAELHKKTEILKKKERERHLLCISNILKPKSFNKNITSVYEFDDEHESPCILDEENLKESNVRVNVALEKDGNKKIEFETESNEFKNESKKVQSECRNLIVNARLAKEKQDGFNITLNNEIYKDQESPCILASENVNKDNERLSNKNPEIESNNKTTYLEFESVQGKASFGDEKKSEILICINNSFNNEQELLQEKKTTNRGNGKLNLVTEKAGNTFSHVEPDSNNEKECESFGVKIPLSNVNHIDINIPQDNENSNEQEPKCFLENLNEANISISLFLEKPSSETETESNNEIGQLEFENVITKTSSTKQTNINTSIDDEFSREKENTQAGEVAQEVTSIGLEIKIEMISNENENENSKIKNSITEAKNEVKTPLHKKLYCHGDLFPSPILAKNLKHGSLSCSFKKFKPSFQFDRECLNGTKLTPKRDENEKFFVFLSQIKDLNLAPAIGDKVCHNFESKAKRSVKF